MSQVDGLKPTPLFDYYQEQGVIIKDFNGWALPIQFTKIQEEHEAIRENVGLFETSHMGEILVTGSDAESFINSVITNDIRLIKIGQAQYTTIVNEDGGILDDLIIYKLSSDRFMFTPNASNSDKINAWLNDHIEDYQVEIQDLSNKVGLIAIQGPNSAAVLEKITNVPLHDIKNYHFVDNAQVGTVGNILLSRTGYTGEDGFELYCDWADTTTLWLELLAAGSSFNIQQCGLGARDTLRLEAGMSLYGQELDEEINPIEAGLSFAVKLNKDVPFIGQKALQLIKTSDNQRISRGFELLERGIARQDYPVFNQEGYEIGFVTSGTQSPTFKKSIGLMLIEKKYAAFGTEVFIQIRKKKIPAVITKKDWLKRNGKL